MFTEQLQKGYDSSKGHSSLHRSNTVGISFILCQPDPRIGNTSRDGYVAGVFVKYVLISVKNKRDLYFSSYRADD